MVVLEKGEEPTEKSHSPVYVGSWMFEGDIYLEIMDDSEKCVIVSMAPEFYVSLLQKAVREAHEGCPEVELPLGEAEIKLSPTGKVAPKINDTKLAVV